MAGNLQLLVKSADLKFKEQVISCSKDWHVSDLKIHVSNLMIVGKSSALPKVIYSGRLLMDDEKLDNIFKQSSSGDVHTVYLVVSSSVESPSPTSSANVQQPLEEGLRKRNLASPSTNSSTDLPSGSMFVDQSNFSTHAVYPSPPAVHPAPHVPSPYFLPQSYPFFPAAGGVDAGGFLMPNQSMWMQAYVEYMDQYMRFLQNGDQQVQPQTLTDEPRDVPNAPDRIAPPPREQRPVQRMNAQGGAFLMDDEEEEQNRDWLDWTYVVIRFSMLMCILYFYTTPSKFLVFIIASLLFFLYQGGWLFLPLFNQRNVNNAQLQRAEAGAENGENAREEAAGNINNDNPRTNGVILQFLYTFWSIFVGLFTSLAPQVPPPVNAN